MVAVCAGLVTVDAESDAIRLVHYTAQEYFETRLDWIATAEAYITKICLAYLSLDYFEDEFWDKRDSELVSWWLHYIHSQMTSFHHGETLLSFTLFFFFL